MSKRETYCQFRDDEDSAQALCTMKNQACRRAGNTKDIYAIVEGPEDNFAVVDIETAIEMGCGYEVIG